MFPVIGVGSDQNQVLREDPPFGEIMFGAQKASSICGASGSAEAMRRREMAIDHGCERRVNEQAAPDPAIPRKRSVGIMGRGGGLP